eukprot:CAMPEP_0113484674 /NCGR_PEP_ID=MMETSP0014_2-20120614/24086_1 /TAXON_ID=2857 /ORGANISM="Nitzschia sp." /LENGTH=253 /DNA_ID=CAMNT_0000378289 /DNA_START=253 /DNA_END=1014 /DNA_ORIENTATION=+ /assembly_acc=CAM_ASM_000159
MVKFSLDDDDDDDDHDNHNDNISYRRGRGRGRGRPIEIETLDDYDVQKSFEAMDRHKFEVLTPFDAYQIILALGYLGHGTHHSDKQKFTYTRFQNEVRARLVVAPATPAPTTELTMVGQQRHRPQNSNDTSNSVDREYEEEIVTLPMLLDIIKKNSNVLQRNRSENLDHTFGVFDQDGKGYLTASDLQRIASEVGGDDDEGLSAEEAEAMARLTTTKTTGAAAAAAASTTSSSPGTARVSLTDFRRLLAPPSP